MPYPNQVQRETIIQQAAVMIERESAESLALAKLAAVLGIKAPSLYHHFASKNALLRAVNHKTIQELTEAMQLASSSTENTVLAQMLAVGRSYRMYAQANPACYALAFGRLPDEARPDPALLEQMALPFQAVMARWSGVESSLMALRGLWSLVHGFSLLEINGQFQRGGDLEAAFEQVLVAYLQGVKG